MKYNINENIEKNIVKLFLEFLKILLKIKNKNCDPIIEIVKG